MYKEKITYMKKRISIILFVIMLVAVSFNSYAADISVTFGSKWYEPEAKDKYNIGLYVKSENNIEDIQIKLVYDVKKMKYIDISSGNVEVENNTITLKDTLNNTNKKYMFTFENIGGGSHTLEVTSVEAWDSNNNKLVIQEMPKVDIRVADWEGETSQSEPSTSVSASSAASSEASSASVESSVTVGSSVEKSSVELVERNNDDKDNKNNTNNVMVFIIILLVAVAIITVAVVVFFNSLTKKKTKSIIHNDNDEDNSEFELLYEEKKN